MNNEEVIKELLEADCTLAADGYKTWCQVRIAISSAITALNKADDNPYLLSGDELENAVQHRMSAG